MRILVLHSQYLSGSLSGENRVVDEEIDLLRQGGHDVSVLSPSPEGMPVGVLAGRTLVSAGIARETRERVRAHEIDVVHCHNLFPALGPGVLRSAAEAGAAVLLTLHNFRLSCVAGTFFRDGRVCQDCLGRAGLPGVAHGCYRRSRLQSATLAASLAMANVRRTFGFVDRFLAVSSFVRDTHIQAGYPADRILVKPNVVRSQGRRTGPGEYFLVLSRLSVEKGIADLVRAWAPDTGELRVVGDGPERGVVEQLARTRGVSVERAVEPDAIPELLAGARAVLVPSRCFEGQPRVVLEAFAAGVPVIASRIGSLPELVLDGHVGITVEPGHDEGWRDAARRLSDDELSRRYGETAYATWRSRFNPEQGLAALEAAYREAIETHGARRASSHKA